MKIKAFTLSRAKNLAVVFVLICSVLSFATTSARATPPTCAQGGACAVGDTGPGGGTVFYVAPTTFTQESATATMCSTSCRYLEVAPSTWNGSGANSEKTVLLGNRTDAPIAGLRQDSSPVFSANELGLGYKNSLLLNADSRAITNTGIKFVRNYRGGALDDWYVPDATELNLLVYWSKGLTPTISARSTSSSSVINGNFDTTYYYYSSSQDSGPTYFGAHIQSFSNGVTVLNQWSDAGMFVRPIRAFAPVTTISVAAIGGVIAPVTGATPVTTVTAANGYTGTVSWSGSPSTFAASTPYTATITITPATGYTLSGVSANFFTVAGATSVTHNADSGVITAVFPATSIALPAFALSASTGDASMRAPYSGYSITSTGGAVASWSIIPALNNGLTFDTSTGLISGTPTSAQARTDYTISATNLAGTTSHTFGLLINAPLVDAQSASASSAVFGSTLTVTGLNLDVVTNGYITYTNSVTNDRYQGTISTFLNQSSTSLTFRVPAQGTFRKTVNNIHNTSNQIAPVGVVWSITLFQTGLNAQYQSEASITITDTPPSPVILSPANNSVINGTVGSPLSASFSISGTAPYYVTASGALPAGLSMTSGGVISGTPTSDGTTTLNFTVQDALLGPSVSVTGISFVIAKAPVVVVASVPVPDPLQQSKISSWSTLTGTSGVVTPIVVQGSFVEKVTAIQVNGVSLAAGSWVQTPTTISFSVPAKAVGNYQIQIFNGSVPVLTSQQFTVSAPAVKSATAAPGVAKSKIIYIRCIKKGHGTRIAYGTNPVCPVGFTKQ